MITNIFEDEIEAEEVLDYLVEGHDSEGEYISYSDERGTISSLEIKPSQPNVVIQHDREYGSAIYSYDDVEEAVEVFLGYVEMHEKSDRPVSLLTA